MLRASLRTLLAHKVRLVLTALAIALGVAFMSGTFTFTATLQHDLDSLFRSATAGTDVVVRHTAPSFEGGGNAGARPTIPGTVLDQVRAVPGVSVADGVILDQAQLTTVDGKLAGAGPGLATTWRPDAALGTAFPLHAGRGPSADGEVAIDQTSATAYGYHVGDPIGVVVAGRAYPLRVVGIVGFGTGNGPGRALVLFHTQTAQHLFHKDGRYDEIDVKAGTGVTAAALRDRVAAGLPGGVEALTSAAVAADTSASLKGDLGFLTDALLAFAAIALFVGAFVIWNTFSILVAQRTRELALLRALGASGRQVFAGVLVEAVLLGTVASAAGVGLGLLAARGLALLLRTFGLDLRSAGPRLPLAGTLLAVLTGVLVTVLAAIAPARRATRVPPVAAMREAAPTPYTFSRRRLLAGLALAVLGLAALGLGLSGGSLPAAGAGALAALLGITVLAPLFTRPLVAAIGAPLTRLPGRTGRLAKENAMHNPRRTAATAAALMIGLAAVTGMAVVIDSVKAEARADIGASSRADLYVSAGSPDAVLDPAVVPALAAAPGVARVSEVRRSDAVVAGSPHQAVYGVDPASVADVTDLGLRTGELSGLGTGGLLVSTSVAASHHWRVGSVVPVGFGQAGERDLRVAGTFAHRGPLGDYLLDLATFDAATGRPQDNLVLVDAAPGTDVTALRADLTRQLAAYPGAQVLDKAGFASAQGAMLDQILNLTTGLLVLAVVIALLGIVNTLALSVTERTRELGILRAIGMRRGQLAATVTVEAAIIAVFGALLGIAVGSGLGAALAVRLTSMAPAVVVPVPQLVAYLVASVLAAVLAALAPARRAARMDVLAAIATE